ncbi:MAG TPA: phosphatase PAP2 family protein [Bacteroidetes bacterium]|nr:phosphatase PAP2 family protein [Bacteroidota bacterium]
MRLRYVVALLWSLFLIAPCLFSQNAHNMSGKLDGPLLAGGVATFSYSFYLMNKVEPLTEAQVREADPLQVKPLDRVSTRQWSPRAHKTSDLFLRASFISQFALLTDQESRDEIGAIGVMAAEVAFINNGITNIFKGAFKRSRPFVYNPAAPMGIKKEKNARWSFFSGHASNSASYTFFAAKVYTDNNPGSKWNPYVWTTAAVVPAITSLLRVKAGKHFPTDVVVGYAVGAAIGIIVPQLHK